jgi:hypothetical protein
VLDSSLEVFHLEEELAVVQVCAIVGVFADRQISDVAIQQVRLIVVVVVINVVAVLLISAPLKRILAPPPSDSGGAPRHHSPLAGIRPCA